jgi:hypothetical protein
MHQSEKNTIILRWNQRILDAIRCSRTSPPLAARALAMVHTAMYDAWSVFDEYAISTTTGRYVKILDAKYCTPENIRKAFSYAAYRVLMDQFWLALPPENKSIFRDFMCELNLDPDDNTLDIKKPQGIGNLMARLGIEYRYGDGSNPLGTVHAPAWSDYAGYEPVNTPDKINDLNRWQPQRTKTRSGELRVQSFLVPHWGLVKPFALDHNWQFRPGVPPGKYQPQFKQQAQEVIEVSAGLTDEQKVIAEYWADGPGTYTPPGHWFEIGQFIATKRNFNDSQCIKMFFALGNALLDASIACWECKCQYDYVRPVTAIRELFKGKQISAWAGPHQGTKTIKGENWQPYITTPPFPEYVSGHSSFSCAAATILRCFTGKDDFYGQFSFEKGNSEVEPGTTPGKTVVLSWPTFTLAARQAGMSRLYGGIHFTGANEGGLQLGLEVGQLTWEKSKFYFNR